MAANLSGSAVIDVKRSGASIVGGGNKPTLTAQSAASAAVSGWTSDAVTTGDVIEFNLDSATTATFLNLVLKVTRSS
jgi:heptaprenylglyceryl phosphate synthase